jgi:4-hydroxybenzoate decarboxylase subunit C
MTTRSFPDLRTFLQFLEPRGELCRVRAPVDPRLEITEIACRVVRQGGPALLFENVKGSRFPLLINIFGTARRIEALLGRAPGDVGRGLAALAEDLMPPRPAVLWKNRGLLARALHMRPRVVARAPVCEVAEEPDLDAVPVLTCWPEDGGRFITYPLVVTRSPRNGKRNIGIYRMHVYNKRETGMHWQIQKGGGFHHAEAEERGEALPVAVVLGADPVLMLAGIFPLPENVDELAFAGFLRGARTPVAAVAGGSLEIPAQAEMVLEGSVAPGERRQEGPFGDHFGHYSQAAPFPVFRVQRFYHRRDAIYPAAVVGKPPQEDKFMGNAAQEMFLPLLKVMRPELIDLWAYFEAGFHNLAVASVKQRYPKEALKTAFGLLGEGQMSLTKCLILVDPGVNVRNFSAVLDEVRKNFDPKADFLLLPGTAQDTLDFTGPAMNLGSKMILDATGAGSRPAPGALPALSGLGPDVLAHKAWQGALLAVQVRKNGRSVLERLVREPGLQSFRLIAAVSEDVPLNDPELLLWGIFTRFDCARDLVPARVELRGAWPVYDGPLGLDATWKEGYPKPLEMDPDVVKTVDARWKEYGIPA